MLQEITNEVTNEPFSLIYYHLPWWILVRLAIKLQPMLETTTGNGYKGLENVNFCSNKQNLKPVTGMHLLSSRITHIHSWRNARDLGGGTLRSASWAVAPLEQPICELGRFLCSALRNHIFCLLRVPYLLAQLS